jgi:hypothetical protein
MDHGHPKTDYRTTPTEVLLVRRGTAADSHERRAYVSGKFGLSSKEVFPGNGPVVRATSNQLIPVRIWQITTTSWFTLLFYQSIWSITTLLTIQSLLTFHYFNTYMVQVLTREMVYGMSKGYITLDVNTRCKM